jgi:uncharacterized damage-inducible protein DinB
MRRRVNARNPGGVSCVPRAEVTLVSDVLPWLEYRWNFDFPVGMFRAIVERLRGAPARLEEAVQDASPERVTRRPGEAWSTQEHAGHLLSVEALWHRRIEEYLRGEGTLTAADMENRATKGSNYNERSLEEILKEFRAARGAFLRALDVLDLDAAARTAHHPRLNRPMRLVDMCFFAAEHDDHHLATIHDLLR